jgi:hypothetical protein
VVKTLKSLDTQVNLKDELKDEKKSRGFFASSFIFQPSAFVHYP